MNGTFLNNSANNNGGSLFFNIPLLTPLSPSHDEQHFIHLIIGGRFEESRCGKEWTEESEGNDTCGGAIFVVGKETEEMETENVDDYGVYMKGVTFEKCEGGGIRVEKGGRLYGEGNVWDDNHDNSKEQSDNDASCEGSTIILHPPNSTELYHAEPVLTCDTVCLGSQRSIQASYECVQDNQNIFVDMVDGSEDTECGGVDSPCASIQSALDHNENSENVRIYVGVGEEKKRERVNITDHERRDVRIVYDEMSNEIHEYPNETHPMFNITNVTRFHLFFSHF
jgi:hypothetical protein